MCRTIPNERPSSHVVPITFPCPAVFRSRCDVSLPLDPIAVQLTAEHRLQLTFAVGRATGIQGTENPSAADDEHFVRVLARNGRDRRPTDIGSTNTARQGSHCHARDVLNSAAFD